MVADPVFEEFRCACREVEERGETYTVDYHLQRVNPEIRKIFYALQERIKVLAGVEELTDQKSGITYRTTKSFVRFEFRKNSIKVLLRDPAYDDPRGFVKDTTSFEWGYRGLAKIKSQDDGDYVFGPVKQSYESTL